MNKKWLVIRNGLVMDPKFHSCEPSDILIHNGKINETLIYLISATWLLSTDRSCTGHTRDAAFVEPSQAAPGSLEVRNTQQVSRDVSRWKRRGAGTSVMPVC